MQVSSNASMLRHCRLTGDYHQAMPGTIEQSNASLVRHCWVPGLQCVLALQRHVNGIIFFMGC